MESADDGMHIRSYTAHGKEFDVRRKDGDKYFAVFPNEEVLVVSRATAQPAEAAYVGNEIAEMLS